ncbi:MAG TPA: efflux RND transporter periplasmic adaptor subunit [Fimbriimonas sp.]|nr:efflux RND transporter periplasmic adaptor subunit [Fimbriimonas sp.]
MKPLFLAVLGLSLIGCGSQIPEISAPPSASPVRVEIGEVRSVERPQIYEAVGSVRARLNATLSSKVMARVSSVEVREGDAVSPGQVLVTLDSRELTAGVQIAQANLSAAAVGVDNAKTARDMEAKTSAARIAQAEAAVQQSRAAVAAAQSKLDLVLAGPRVEEKTQAHLAVIQAESNLKLAKTQLDRVTYLVSEDALARKSLDEAQNAYDLALAQRDTAVQAEKIALEGSRAEEVRSAREAVTQAKAAAKQAEANLAQAQASSMQTKVRAEEVRGAMAQVKQSSAAVRSAQVSLAYAVVTAPFQGRVVKRIVDPGAMATPGSPLLSIEGGDLRLEAAVPESVLPHLNPKCRVPVVIDAVGKQLQATVAEIVPQGDAASHTFLVKLALPQSNAIHSGMFGRARIATGENAAVEIPETAVWEREGIHYVFVVNRDGLARLRMVTVGDTTDGRTQVLSGLAPHERIVTAGRDRVTDGQKVIVP